MAVVHISEEDAVKDFSAVLSRIDGGEDIVIERRKGQVRLWSDARLQPMTFAQAAEQLPAESVGVIDEDFERDARSFREGHAGESLRDPWE